MGGCASTQTLDRQAVTQRISTETGAHSVTVQGKAGVDATAPA